jgi:hypothetical protein
MKTGKQSHSSKPKEVIMTAKKLRKTTNVEQSMTPERTAYLFG